MSPWIKWLALGIVTILLGLVALNHAVLTSLAVTTFVGALLILGGVLQAVGGVAEAGAWSKIFGIALGVLMALLGVSFLSNPLAGTISLALVVTVFIAAGGILRLIFAWRLRGEPAFWLMLISGALSLLLAGYILANPGVTIALLGILLGIELIFSGAGLIALALWLRRNPPSGTGG